MLHVRTYYKIILCYIITKIDCILADMHACPTVTCLHTYVRTYVDKYVAIYIVA